MADCERVARRVLRLESDRQVLRCLQEELGQTALTSERSKAGDPAVIGTVLDFFRALNPGARHQPLATTNAGHQLLDGAVA